jgi:uncharacterized protein YutD
VYRDGRGYTFERLRAKVLFTDRLQKRISVQEKVKTKKKQRFEDVSMGRMAYFMMSGVCEERAEYEVRTQTRQDERAEMIRPMRALNLVLTILALMLRRRHNR